MELEGEQVTACFESVGMRPGTFEERPFMVAHDVSQWRRVQREPSVHRWSESGGQRTRDKCAHDSLADGGILAFPLNCKVISLIEVGSVRWRTTFPLSRAGVTSTPVPRSTSVSEFTLMSTYE